MKSTNIAYIILSLLILTACSVDQKDKTISSVDTRQYENDTFPNALENAGKVTYSTEAKAGDYLEPLLDTLNIKNYIADTGNADSIYSNLKRFYRLQEYELAWYSPERPEKETEALLKILLDAGQHGLDSANYDVFKLANLQNEVYRKDKVHPMELAVLDVRTSVSAITFAWHLKNGIFVPVVEEGLWLKPERQSGVAQYLVRQSVPKAIERLKPAHPNYDATLKAIGRYEKIAKNGGWSTLPDGTMLQQGDTSNLIPRLREQLRLTDDYQGDGDSIYFDKALYKAVQNFQKRHGLEQDGIVGNTTLDALQMSAETKVRILRKNLERMRWMPDSLEDQYIHINLPEYKMTVYESGQEVMDMAVIVGTIENRTPIFHDMLEYLVFSPTWTVPKSIVEKEMLPSIREDPSWLTERDYKVYDSWSEEAVELNPKKVDWEKMTADSIMIVQNPSTTNSLGRVKFMMPNAVSIYLHDTPANHLFNEDERAFSHGCIRIERPVEFAEYLLRDQEEWDAAKIRESLTLEEPETVRLKKHVPVYITYRTAWADQDGVVQFREDIYGLDQKEPVRFASN